MRINKIRFSYSLFSTSYSVLLKVGNLSSVWKMLFQVNKNEIGGLPVKTSSRSFYLTINHFCQRTVYYFSG